MTKEVGRSAGSWYCSWGPRTKNPLVGSYRKDEILPAIIGIMKITKMTWKPRNCRSLSRFFFCLPRFLLVVRWLEFRGGETAKGFNRFLDGSQTSSEKQFSGMMTGGPSLLVFQISIDGDIAKRVPKVGLIASQSHFASHGTFLILFVMSFRFLHTKERCFHCQQKSKFHLFSRFQNTTNKAIRPCLMNLTSALQTTTRFF